MLETAIALILGHLIADFVLQSDAMVRGKRRLPILALHVAIVAVTAWAALGFPPEPALILLIAGSHLIIDAVKLQWGRPGFAAFAADQAGHLAMIAIGSAVVPAAFAEGLWTQPEAIARIPWLGRLPEAMTLASGVLATVWAGGYGVAELMRDLGPGARPEHNASLPRGGRLIGRLERLMILILVLIDEPAGIGFLITAKSILRFGELGADRGTETAHRISEYVIIGTLASFAWALGVSYAVVEALAALRAPMSTP